VALITDMSTPLGLTAGNALEVRESLEVLAGGGPADVVELTLALGREMLDATASVVEAQGVPGAGISASSPEASRMAGRLREADLGAALADGRAMDTWRAMIRAQGGDPDADLGWATCTQDVICPADGYLTSLDALKVGVAAWRLGAGRAVRTDPVQAGAGVVLHAKPGEMVRKGHPLMTLHTDTPEAFPRALEALDGAWTIGETRVETGNVVMEKVG